MVVFLSYIYLSAVYMDKAGWSASNGRVVVAPGVYELVSSSPSEANKCLLELRSYRSQSHSTERSVEDLPIEQPV